MNYVLKTSPRKNRLLFHLKIVSIIVIVLCLFYIFLPHTLSSFFTYFSQQFWRFSITPQEQSLIKENVELKNKLEENREKYESFNVIKKENEDMKKILGRNSKEHFILAEIIKKPPFSPYDLFILDIGKDHGINEGDLVYSIGDIPIGEIKEVIGNISKMKLYSSYGEKWNVLIGDTHIEVTAIGRGGGAFETTIPRDIKVKKGDDVTVKSLSNSFIGKIEDIISPPSYPFATVLFRQPINIYEMTWVLINTTKHEKI